MSDEEPVFTREQMKDWSRRQLTDTCLAAMAAHQLILKENALLELRLARQDQEIDGLRANLAFPSEAVLRFIEAEERQLSPGDPWRLLNEIRRLLTTPGRGN